MNVVLHIPDDVAERLAHGGNLERQALEALATEAFRAGRLSEADLRILIGAVTNEHRDAASEAHAGSRRRMTADQMLTFGADISAMPVRDTRSPREIMDDINVA